MPGECMPKNMTDQKTFKISCVAKIKIIFAFCHEPDKNFFESKFHDFCFLKTTSFFISHFLSQTRYKEIPISTKIVAHTGPKIQFGGLKDGLFKLLYQVPISEVVKIDPITPANSHMIILVKSFKRLLYFICNLADMFAEFPCKRNSYYYCNQSLPSGKLRLPH